MQSTITFVSADWLTQVVTLGPPVVLVLALVVILWFAINGRTDTKQTLVLAGITAAFFGMWIFSLPELNKRRIHIVTTKSPADLTEIYSLKPVRFSFGVPTDSDLADQDFDLPPGREPLRVRFDLNGLINSYETNLQAIIKVAKDDPDCFDDATRGVSYSKVAARILELCPGTLVRTERIDS